MLIQAGGMETSGDTVVIFKDSDDDVRIELAR